MGVVYVGSHFAWQKIIMVIICCAVGCTNGKRKDSSLKFYRFPRDSGHRNKWISAINRKDWHPSEYSYACSSHFVGGNKSNDPLSPSFVPSIFGKVSGPVKQEQVTDISRYKQSIKRVRSGPSQTCVSSSPFLDQLQDVVIESPKTADASVQATVQTTEKETCTSPEVKQTTQIVELKCALYIKPQWKHPTQVSTVYDGSNETKIKFSKSRSSI